MTKRKGGLTSGRLDPSVVEWQKTAAQNLAARTQKQAYDAARVRVKLDLPRWLKEALAALAAELGTSSTQLGAYCLAVMLHNLLIDEECRGAVEEARRASRTPRNDYDLGIPDEIERFFRDV
jgi:hypothetical protein